MQRLTAIVRRPEGIYAVVSEPSDAGGRFRQRRLPLSTISEAVCPWRDKDVRAWKALARVPSLSRRAAQAIVRTLIGSVVDPALDVADPGAPLFGGGPVDLRPHLCCAPGEERLIALLGEAISELERDTDLPPWHWERRPEIAALPAPFRRELLWGLHLSRWPQVELTLAAYHALGLEDDDVLRAAVSRLLSLTDRETGLWWCDVLADTPAEQRTLAAALVMERGAATERPDPALRQAITSGDLSVAAAALERG